MTELVVKNVSKTGKFVTENHFGGNIVYTRNTTEGVPDSSFLEAADELDMHVLRYPAGMPDVAYSEGLLIDGALPGHLISFMESARENGLKVVIVTPTLGGYNGPEELERFTKLLLDRYASEIHAFEIGNEYWNHQNESEYGEIANDSVLALSVAMEEVATEKDIWVQMGDAGGRMSSFNAIEEGWVERNVMANNAILAELSTDAKDNIDGVVEHYYFRSTAKYFGDLAGLDQLISMDYDIWQTALHDDISLNITEWNIRTTNYFQLGVRAASTMVAQFEFLIELGVDEAYVWPPQHNTSSDLAGPAEVLYDEETGLVINTVGGAVFDLMSSSLVGLENLETEMTGGGTKFQNYVYANDERLVVYLTSRTDTKDIANLSLGENWLGATLTSAIRVGYDPASSDGVFYNFSDRAWEEAESIQLDGKKYVLNEHDVNAKISKLDPKDVINNGDVQIELKPFEIIELTFDLSDGPVTNGTQANDTLSGSGAAETFFLLDGSDVINAGAGNDIVYGGEGNDFINAGAGMDIVAGGGGNDSIRGWGGSDKLLGGDGADRIDGWFGDDSLVGGSGNDSLTGGKGNDRILGGQDHDKLTGGDGDDSIFGGIGNDRIFAQAGNDHVVGGNGIDSVHLGIGNDIYEGNGSGGDVVRGLAGHDTISGGSGNDLLLGHLGHDSIDGNGGNDTIRSGIAHDKISGGSGDDSLDAGAGWDTLDGGSGNDTLIGRQGNDMLSGGLGADTFVFSAKGGKDTIRDFEVGIDNLEISYAGQKYEGLKISQHGTDTAIWYGSGGIILEKVNATDILEADFIFV